MKFVLVIYHGASPLPGSAGWKGLSEEQQKGLYAEYAELNKAAGVTPGLPPIAPKKATTVQVKDGKVQAKEGPYLSEGIGGAFLFDADDMDAAIAMAARVPQARMGGAVEIRPVEKYF
jgi:hypothetical protein